MPQKNETSYTSNPGFSQTDVNEHITYNAHVFVNGSAYGVSKVNSKSDTGFGNTNQTDTPYNDDSKADTGYTVNTEYDPTAMNANLTYNSITLMNGLGYGDSTQNVKPKTAYTEA